MGSRFQASRPTRSKRRAPAARGPWTSCPWREAPRPWSPRRSWTPGITWALDGVGAAEVRLSPADAASGEWLHGRRRIRFSDGGGTVRYGGWLDRLERSGKPSDIRYRASSRGLAAIMDQRVVHGDVSWTATVATTIATNLIAHMVAQTYDQTGFTVGTITGTAPARSRWYCDGDVIKDSIDELANLSNGFSWEISPTGAFNAWVGGRGTDVSASVTLAPSVTIDWVCTADASEFATYATAIGDVDEETPCGAPVQIDFNTHRTAYGRREVVVVHPTRDDGELLEAATEGLRAQAASGLNLRTAWVEGQGPWSFGTRWLGDIVDVTLGAEFGGSADMRCIGISVILEPTTSTGVSLHRDGMGDGALMAGGKVVRQGPGQEGQGRHATAQAAVPVAPNAPDG